MVLLEEVAGVGAVQAGRRRIWGEEADARAADMGREPSSFQVGASESRGAVGMDRLGEAGWSCGEVEIRWLSHEGLAS